MDKTIYVPGNEVKKKYRVSTRTLNRWADSGRLGHVRSPGGKRLYSQEDVHVLFGLGTETASKAKICYARVSSTKQRADLERQADDLRQAYPNHEIITEIGSGLNYSRPKFRALLDRVYSGTVAEVCVASRDRLCRYGLELVEFIFSKSNTKLVVHMQSADQTPNEELAEDLLAVVNFFVAKNNGRQAAKKRKMRQTGGGEITENPLIPHPGSEVDLE
jgi:putative resolvase